MRRVAVIGCGGSGKTTLARRLGAALSLPVVHSDHYRPGWEDAHPRLTGGETWVIDAMRLGTLDERLARADTAVFLDVHPLRCLLGIARRRLRYRGGLHADGVADYVDVAFLRWVLGFRRRVRPRVTALLERHSATTNVVVIRSWREADAFATSVERGEVPGRARRGRG